MCGRTTKAKKGKKECVYVWEDKQGIKKEEGCMATRQKKNGQKEIVCVAIGQCESMVKYT